MDEGIWPKVDVSRYEAALHMIESLEHIPRFALENPIVRLLSGIPTSWLSAEAPDWGRRSDLICVTTTERQIDAIEAAYGSALDAYRWCSIGIADLEAAGWHWVGFDVADFTGSISALSGTRYSDRDRGQLSDFVQQLNEFHLLPNATVADDYRQIRDDQVTEHSPLDLFGIFVHYKSRSMAPRP